MVTMRLPRQPWQPDVQPDAARAARLDAIAGDRPAGLSAGGAALWDECAPDLEPAGLALLAEICRQSDLLADLSAAVLRSPLWVRGSTGQPRASPMLRELSEQRRTMALLVSQLGAFVTAGAESDVIDQLRERRQQRIVAAIDAAQA